MGIEYATIKLTGGQRLRKPLKKGIKFDTLSIGDSRWFTELSEMTNGVHSPFSTFTVVFKKQDKAKTKKQFESEKEAQRMEAISMIDKAKRQEKSMATAYKEALEFVQSNPIKDYTEGEDRVLRGFKIQFVSRDGKYRCMDMDIEKTEKDTGERLVNINTISQLIYNGVKYTVE